MTNLFAFVSFVRFVYLACPACSVKSFLIIYPVKFGDYLAGISLGKKTS
jgi:hypothetical protein